MASELNNTPKEVDVFKKYSKNNKLYIILVAVLIASIVFSGLFFFIKSLLTYTVTFELNGGYVYGVEDNTLELKFLEKIYTPFAKKRGYYLVEWCKDEKLKKPFKDGTRIWNDMTLYAHWEEGYAVRLNFAEGEENEDLSLLELQLRYEQYVKEGSTWSLPKVYNENKSSEHYGEQLMWYDNPECEGDPFDEKTYTVTENSDIYGKWFDTKEEKFEIDENGTLNHYRGKCRNIILPNSVEKIRGIAYNEFRPGFSDQQFGKEYHSVFMNVLGDKNNRNSLNMIYLNENLKEIGECAFMTCTSLNSVYFLGNKVTTIGEHAFDNCTSLENITLPSSVTSIPKGCFNGAFAYESGVTEVTLTLGSSITSISEEAFINSRLYKIVLNNVNFIDTTAFDSCGELRVIEINSNTVIESNATESDPLFDSQTYVEPSDYVTTPKLVIYVLPELVDTYKATYPWSKYAKVILSK